MGNNTSENYNDGFLTKELFELWGYKPGLRNESFQKEVHIPNKKIIWIEPTLFNGFTKLTILDMSNNQIIEMSDILFGGLKCLKKLYLNNNKIVSIGFNNDRRKLFEGLNNLEELHLNNNKIDSIPEYAFKDLTNLMELRLDSNCIKSIRYESLTGLKNLKELNLKWNNILFVSADTFQGCDRLCFNLLDHNKLEEIFGKKYDIGCNPVCKKNLRIMPNKSIIFDEI